MSRRRSMGRAIVVLPSTFTLANLFFGFWSMVLASQGEFYRASWWIVIAGVLDTLDGLAARMGKAGTRFGAELDSLVDIVSFGIAPAFLMYHLHFAALGPFAWLFCFGFATSVALRLARYNTSENTPPVGGFFGLPSTAAGMTLAAYYPFTQTPFFQTQLTGLPWNQILLFLPIVLGLAMLSNVHYPKLPRIGIRTAPGIYGLVVNVTLIGFVIFSRDIFFFPLALTYVMYGMARGAVLVFLERGEDESQEDESDPSIARQPALVKDRRGRRRG